MSRPFGPIKPYCRGEHTPYAGLTSAQQGRVIKAAEDKRARRNARRLAEKRP
jgi:hypothetical protein